MGQKESLDPRQIAFLSGYLNPDSPTYANALQSALKAGYSQEYAESITKQAPNWLTENLGTDKLVNKALNRLDELLGDTEDKKVVADLAKFVLKTKGNFKEKTETEHSGEVVIKWQDEE